MENQHDDLSMEEYFNEGLADGTEPNNPFAVAEPEPKQKQRKKKAPKLKPVKEKEPRKKRVVSGKRVMIAVICLAVLAMVLAVVILIGIRRNDGARYARKLSESIGMPVKDAEKNANISLKSDSAYTTLNQIYASFQGIAESKKTCKVQGVRLPEWAIFCNTNADELTNVTYYNYEVLEKNVFGTVRKSYQDPNLISETATPENVESQFDLTPYRIQYLQGQKELREYRYCYIDGDKGDIVAYVITAVWDNSTGRLSISDSRKNYIGSLLASPEPPA